MPKKVMKKTEKKVEKNAKPVAKNVAISINEIKNLREKTFAGMALCKEALVKSGGDMAKAIEYVNKRSDVIGRLFNLTGAKIGNCKVAYELAGKDFEKAIEIIKEKGWAVDVAKGPAVAKEGVIGTYVHGVNQKVVALVELVCDTDFVAKNEEFRNLAHELAMQVASTKAKYADRDSIPADVIEEQKKALSEDPSLKKKPAEIVEKIIEGKMNKFYEENCLLDQKYFRDETKTMRNLVDEVLGKLGEKIRVGRIYRMAIGE